MERKKYILLILFFFINSFLLGQNSHDIYDAYSKSDMETWKRIIDDMGKKTDESDAYILQLINFQYGYIAWCIGTDKNKEAKNYLDIAKKHLNSLEKKGYRLADVYAYRAAFIGYEIAMSPYKAPFIGMESLTFAKKSIDTDPLNPIGYIQLGNIMFYMPEIFGGSKEKAIELYQKALEIMETNPSEKDWNFLNLLGSIINLYIETQNFFAANELCIKSLDIEPNFSWVKNDLYPKTLKQLKQ